MNKRLRTLGDVFIRAGAQRRECLFGLKGIVPLERLKTKQADGGFMMTDRIKERTYRTGHAWLEITGYKRGGHNPHFGMVIVKATEHIVKHVDRRRIAITKGLLEHADRRTSHLSLIHI